MFATRNLFAALAVAILISACGDKPLTDAQKARFLESFSDVKDTGGSSQKSMTDARNRGVKPTASMMGLSFVQATLSASPQMKALPVAVKKLFGGYFGLDDTFSSSPLQQTVSWELPKEQQEYRSKRRAKREEKLAKVESTLETRYVDGSCTLPQSDLNAIAEKAGNKDVQGAMDIKFRITGDKCPIFAEIQVQSNSKDPKNVDAKITMNFEVKDKDLIEVSEVRKISITMTASGNNDPRNSKGDFNLEGSILTAEEGELKISLNANGNSQQSENGSGSGEFNLDFRMEFKDFNVHLEVDASGSTREHGAPEKSDVKIRLNGEETNFQELAAVFAGQNAGNQSAPAEGAAVPNPFDVPANPAHGLPGHEHDGEHDRDESPGLGA